MPLQQPGQLVGSQTQAPATHFWPTPQAGPVPQLQPASPQPSALAPQAAQVLPWLPHALTVPVTHCPLEQQPFGQDAGVHWQTPETHCWPAPHAPFAPQPHTPWVQLSVETLVVQSAHTEPSAPQEVSALGRQTPLKQQPLGQVVESQPLQVMPVQLLPEGQC